jgi:hypothetical protein
MPRGTAFFHTTGEKSGLRSAIKTAPHSPRPPSMRTDPFPLRHGDWGEVGAQRLSSGHIYAVYDQGFARRYVYAKMSQYRPGQLWVYTWTDFTDPDYELQNWFVRQ